MSDAITIRDVCKSYGRTEALRGLSLTVGAGSTYGIIGANGAGKTTTLSILAGLLRADSGSASILGTPVSTDDARIANAIGFYSPQYAFFDYLTGRELLALGASTRNVPRDEAARRIEDLIAVFDLQQAADHYVYEYSQGMRQKLGLAGALIHAPRVLLLDEPFDGLDATAVYRLVATLQSLAAAGRAILITSHDLALVQRVCDRVGILHEGRIERELDRAALGPDAAPGGSSLESLLWQVVGSPQVTPLPWI